jgi:hypothetical protein
MECRPQDARKARRLRRRVENLAARAAEGSTGTYVFIASADGSAVEVVTPAQCSAHTQKSAIRIALESGDAAAMVAALLAYAEPVGDCMVWQRKVDQRGYGEVSVAGKSYRTHRLMGEALFGPLHGEPIHHTCANRTCIAPVHMQRVSQRENVAEMLERTWYQRRIDELEKALAACAPDHHLLAGAA